MKAIPRWQRLRRRLLPLQLRTRSSLSTIGSGFSWCVLSKRREETKRGRKRESVGSSRLPDKNLETLDLSFLAALTHPSSLFVPSPATKSPLTPNPLDTNEKTGPRVPSAPLEPAVSLPPRPAPLLRGREFSELLGAPQLLPTARVCEIRGVPRRPRVFGFVGFLPGVPEGDREAERGRDGAGTADVAVARGGRRRR